MIKDYIISWLICMGTSHKERKQRGKQHREERQKGRYPSRAFATFYWVMLGITLPLVFTIPLTAYYMDYIGGLIWGSLIWGFFLVGSILYTIHYGRNGIRICPNCGKRVFKGRKYCDGCGARIFWLCPKCGKRAEKKREFCEHCGQSLKIVTHARQVEFESDLPQDEKILKPIASNLIVTGSVVQFCPACGAEINEDLTHCSICGSTLRH